VDSSLKRSPCPVRASRARVLTPRYQHDRFRQRREQTDRRQITRRVWYRARRSVST